MVRGDHICMHFWSWGTDFLGDRQVARGMVEGPGVGEEQEGES